MISNTLRLLMVEDNPGDARLVQVLLKEQAYGMFDFRHVVTIEEARRIIDQETFDAVLLDLGLPDSQGIESLDALQSLARDIPIVVLSGNGDEALAAEVFGRGAQDFLLKDGLTGHCLAHCLFGAVRRYQVQAVLRDMAFIDELTGLYNRRGFMQLAGLEIKRCSRTNQDLAVFFLDMDGLKRINDTQGHLAGDRALQDVAKRIQESFRDTDLIARMGGDEFAVLAAGTQADILGDPLSRLEEKLETFNLAHPDIPLSVSTGVACYDPLQAQSIEMLLANADALMYDQKRRKKPMKT